ncbi:hypothetical protein C0J52_12829 [Blattella germanica]|nr:hypothetical protein C0J52_12829 [Blattella germanica]
MSLVCTEDNVFLSNVHKSVKEIDLQDTTVYFNIGEANNVAANEMHQPSKGNEERSDMHEWCCGTKRNLKMKAAIVLFATCFLLMNTARGAYTVIEGHGMYRVGQSTAAANAWAVAYDTCRKEGGNLAVIDSTQEANALKPLLAASTSQFFYIGFTDILIEGHYLTIYAEQAVQPQLSNIEEALPGHVGLQNMENRILHVIVWLLVYTAVNLAQNTKRYTAIDGLGMYRIGKVTTATNAWSLAYQACLNDGAHLAIINSKAEADALRTLITNSGSTSTYFYIGFSDIYDESHFTTIHGGNFVPYVNASWDTSEPKVSTTLNVVRLNRNLKLSVADGVSEYAFICEYEKLQSLVCQSVYSDKIAAHKEKNTLVTQKRLKEQEDELVLQMKGQEEKLRKMRRILDKETTFNACTPLHATKYVTNIYQTPIASDSNNVVSSHSSRRGLAVSNTRHRRSRSAGDELWLDHRPAMPVELGTVLQPTMKKRKSITKLTDAKDVTNPKTSKYCLMTQEQDSAGEVETRLYKADVVPTTGGGAQVIFKDVETLKQHSPTSSPPRKRTASAGDCKDVEAACSVALEGHKRAKF